MKIEIIMMFVMPTVGFMFALIATALLILQYKNMKAMQFRLEQNLDRNHLTFVDVSERLQLIDEAQRRMTELSSDVVSLHQLFRDKRSRGVFGEMQLSQLIKDVLAGSQYALQYTLSNGKRADCILFLPQPTGSMVIDAKFPLENYQWMHQPHLSEMEKKRYEQRFRDDVLFHIKSIAEKYIIPNETAEHAILFIPAEGIFADIHAHFPEIIRASHRSKVWLASPNTMMAILTTASAVLKDAASRKQIHQIQKHLIDLAQDFTRFDQRMTQLCKHVQQAHQDIDSVQISAQKITERFRKIERVELEE